MLNLNYIKNAPMVACQINLHNERVVKNGSMFFLSAIYM